MLSQKPVSFSSRSTARKTFCVRSTRWLILSSSLIPYRNCPQQAIRQVPVAAWTVSSPNISRLNIRKKRHLLLAVQPIGRLLAGVDDARPQLLQFLVDLVPVVRGTPRRSPPTPRQRRLAGRGHRPVQHRGGGGWRVPPPLPWSWCGSACRPAFESPHRGWRSARPLPRSLSTQDRHR